MLLENCGMLQLMLVQEKDSLRTCLACSWHPQRNLRCSMSSLRGWWDWPTTNVSECVTHVYFNGHVFMSINVLSYQKLCNWIRLHFWKSRKIQWRIPSIDVVDQRQFDRRHGDFYNTRSRLSEMDFGIKFNNSIQDSYTDYHCIRTLSEVKKK